jgi:hypothetical protein
MSPQGFRTLLISVKGKGIMFTYWLIGKDDAKKAIEL